MVKNQKTNISVDNFEKNKNLKFYLKEKNELNNNNK